MAKLTSSQKRFIVSALACFEAPSEVAEQVRKLYGVDITSNHIARYDPTNSAGADLARDLRLFFDATRQRFLKDVEVVPIAHKTYRLRRLQKIIDSTKSPVIIRGALEQAAKEMGGLYTNKTINEHTGKDGAAIAIAFEQSLDSVYGTAPPAEAA